MNDKYIALKKAIDPEFPKLYRATYSKIIKRFPDGVLLEVHRGALETLAVLTYMFHHNLSEMKSQMIAQKLVLEKEFVGTLRETSKRNEEIQKKADEADSAMLLSFRDRANDKPSGKMKGLPKPLHVINK